MATSPFADTLNAWFYRQMALWAGLLGRRELELEYWERVRALRPRDTDAMAAVATRRAARGDRQGAIAVLEQSIEIDPSKAHAWFNLGFLQQELDDHDAALHAFDRALALDEKLDRAWYGKALSLIRRDRVEDGVAALKKVIELQPFSPYGYYQLAHAYRRLGQTERIVATIRKLAKFEPKIALQLERETGVDAGIEDPYQPGRRR
ncbi:MAG: tetratricopeptide repeat protein [Burkholderiaceae bacterium]|nr:tetratricopeptide repeat protein [Burkholderiaceae bacterium]